MAYQVLARKYRPQNFEEVVGQEAISRTLKNAISTNQVGHAYIFSGSRGIGKTSMARIFAKALNCEKSSDGTPCNKCEICKSISNGDDIDVIEIDGASNRRIAEARNIRDHVNYSPTRSKYKIYIIDEVHMLTTEAFNALLKTIEEPPSHVKFFLATTEPQKVPETILSRCQRFDFRRISAKEISKRLEFICKSEGVEYEPNSLRLIAKSVKGGMRDAQSILDQLISFSDKKIKIEDINLLLGLVSIEKISEIVRSIKEEDSKSVINIVNNIFNEGNDIIVFLEQLIEYFEELITYSITDEVEDVSPDRFKKFKQERDYFSVETLMYFIQLLSETKYKIKNVGQKKILTELTLLKMARFEGFEKVDKILNDINRIEETIESKNLHPRTTETTKDEEGDVSVNYVEEKQLATKSPVIFGEEVEDTHTGRGINLNYIKEKWPEILEGIRKSNVMLSALTQEARVIDFKEKKIFLGFPPNCKFHKQQLEEFNRRKSIEDEIGKMFGERFEIVCTMLKDETKIKVEEEEEPAVPFKKDESSTQIEDPIIKKALDILDARIVQMEGGK